MAETAELSMPIFLLICVDQFKLQKIAGSGFGKHKPTKDAIFYKTKIAI
jgi:hypothetical protein